VRTKRGQSSTLAAHTVPYDVLTVPESAQGIFETWDECQRRNWAGRHDLGRLNARADQLATEAP